MTFATRILLGFLFGIACLLPATAVHGQDSADNEDPLYNKVILEGAEAFPAKEVLLAAGVKPRRILRLLPSKLKMNPLEVDRILEEILLFYRRHGYFDATAEWSEGAEKTAVIKLIEGPPALVRSVSVEISLEFPQEAKDLLEILVRTLPLRVGDTFTVNEYEESSRILNFRMKESGFPFAETGKEAVVDLDARSVDVYYSPKPGALVHFGPTRIDGVIHTEEPFLRRALAWEEGDLFRQSLIDETLNELYLLGLFDSVSIKVKRKGPPEAAPVVINVKEGRHRKVRASVGYGTEDNVRFSASWDTMRIADRNWFAGFSFRTSSIVSEATTYLKRPYYLDRKNDLLADITYGWYREDSFSYKSWRTRVGIEREYTKRLKGSLFASVERVLQYTPDRQLEDVIGEESPGAATLPSIIATFLYDATDDRLNPTNGYRIMGTIEPTYELDTKVSFTKSTLEGRIYKGIGEKTVFAARAKMGAIISSAEPGEIPLSRRFYAGGFNSIRGYKYNHLGPLSENGVLIGGNGLLEASAEFRYRVKPDWTALFFVDAGNAFLDALSTKGGDIYVGTGVGFRLNTPVGPVGLDLGFKLVDDPRDNSVFLLHFYVGYAF